MLAAASGLSYALATTMHLEGYLGYFLPLPVVLAAMRNGPVAGRKTVTATFFLLLGALLPSGGLPSVAAARAQQPMCRTGAGRAPAVLASLHSSNSFSIA